jgi:hypothetical protein
MKENFPNFDKNTRFGETFTLIIIQIKNIKFFFRPIAGNINICPKLLRSDHNSIDFDRLVSTIKHEILHTLVTRILHFKNNEIFKFHRYFLLDFLHSSEIVMESPLLNVIQQHDGPNIMMKSM